MVIGYGRAMTISLVMQVGEQAHRVRPPPSKRSAKPGTPEREIDEWVCRFHGQRTEEIKLVEEAGK